MTGLAGYSRRQDAGNGEEAPLTRAALKKMTPAQAIEKADELRPNGISEELKRGWLTDIEGECVEHLNRHEGGNAEPWVCTEDEEDTEMILSEPYEMAYVYKLMAEVDRAQGEYDRANSEATVCNGYMEDWKAWYRRNHRPKRLAREKWITC